MIIFGTNPNNLKSKQGWLWTRKHGRKAMLKKTNKGNRGMNKQRVLKECKGITIGRGNPKWGAPTDRDVFIIQLGKEVTK